MVCLTAQVAAALDRLGPFEPNPVLAIAVSGGADSTALAMLARDWTCQRGGSVTALVVDHGLRATSAVEAQVTVERLTSLGIPARILPLAGLEHGTALAERARILRYQALVSACRDEGILHLLLGHHAADQLETLAMRVLSGSQTHGLAGMSAIRDVYSCRLLRPLLAIEPGRLRDYLSKHGVAWVDDPSNQDVRALRPRLRHRLLTVDPTANGLTEAMAAVAALRAREEADTAAEIAGRVTIRPEGFAIVSPGRIGAGALGCLIQTIGGASYPPATTQVRDIAAQLRPATLAGVRIMPAGQLGDGWLVLREETAIAAPLAAFPGMIWDDRFRLTGRAVLPTGTTMAKLGADAVRFRRVSQLPSAVLRTLPAIRIGKVLAAVPHLGYASFEVDARVTIMFSPPRPLAGACFAPAN